MKINKNFPKFLTIILFTFLIINSASLIVKADNANSPATSIPENAIHIQTPTQLAAIGGEDSAGKYYVLDKDIDLISEWIPIKDFRGTFDGQGYSINNLYVLERSNRQYAGLFAYTLDVTIKNVGVNINSKGLTASSGNGAYAGGLVGYSDGLIVLENSYTKGDITAISTSGSACAGGLIGRSIWVTVTIKNSYSTGDITACALSHNVYTGGLIGFSYADIIITDSYTTGDITATASISTSVNAVMSLVSNKFEDCETSAPIREPVSTFAGGLIGNSGRGGRVVNSYTIGDIIAIPTSSDGMAFAGDLVGTINNDINMTGCYRISTQKIIGDTINKECKALSSADMKKQRSFIGWDFETIWTIDPDINGGYPHFLFNEPRAINEKGV
jgi:hypothetical protein